MSRSDWHELLRLFRTPPAMVLFGMTLLVEVALVAPTPQRWLSVSELQERANAPSARAFFSGQMRFGPQNVVAPNPGEPIFGGLPIFVGKHDDQLVYLGSVANHEVSSTNWSADAPPPGTVLIIDSHLNSWNRGWWAATHEYDFAPLRIRSIDGTPVSDHDRTAARGLLVAMLERMNYTPWARTLQSSGVKLRRTIWTGYAHNTATILLVMVVLYAVSGVPSWPNWFRTRPTARSRRRDRGLCGWCAYPRGDLDAEQPCPECGRRPADDFAARERAR